MNGYGSMNVDEPCDFGNELIFELLDPRCNSML